MRNKTFLITVVLILSGAILLMGCSMSRTAKGGAIGAGAGAIIGGLIGKAAGNTAAGAIIGAAIGGAAGLMIGHYMDKQAEEMKRDLKNAKIERVGEGIKITFDSGILFDINKSDLRPEAQTNIRSLAKILNKYEDTNILIEGHTDSTGTIEHNQVLSEQRAASVANYAKGLGVQGSRFSTVGYGESQPIASNTSSEGRQQNRRVEVAIFANDKLKDAAQNGELDTKQ
ncbi:MAG: OmpA family protein [Ignavibacteriae bacterium]|nr:OmpA family protein [Ignavibacteria bacterium]MBI3363407.1 OmpA family protein [Ignavibacteriota bacterium]